jgi:hypothetical protein
MSRSEKEDRHAGGTVRMHAKKRLVLRRARNRHRCIAGTRGGLFDEAAPSAARRRFRL